jgi:hypothetical protein
MLLPGISTVRGSFKQKWDKRHVSGANGKTFTSLGYDPADIEIKVELWEPEHLVTYSAVLARLKPKIKKRLREMTKQEQDALAKARKTKGHEDAVVVEHPALAMLQVRTCIILSISVPQHEGKGIYSSTIRLEEYYAQDKDNFSIAAAKTKKTAPPISSLSNNGGSDRAADPTKPSDVNTGPIRSRNGPFGDVPGLGGGS